MHKQTPRYFVGRLHDEPSFRSSAILLAVTLLQWTSQVNYCPNLGVDTFDTYRDQFVAAVVQSAINQVFRDRASPAQLWQPRCLNGLRDAVLVTHTSAVAGIAG